MCQLRGSILTWYKIKSKMTGKRTASNCKKKNNQVVDLNMYEESEYTYDLTIHTPMSQTGRSQNDVRRINRKFHYLVKCDIRFLLAKGRGEIVVVNHNNFPNKYSC